MAMEVMVAVQSGTLLILVLTTKMRVVSNCPSGGYFFVKNEDEGRFWCAFRGSRTRESKCYLRSMQSLRSFQSNPQELQLIHPVVTLNWPLYISLPLQPCKEMRTRQARLCNGCIVRSALSWINRVSSKHLKAPLSCSILRFHHE